MQNQLPAADALPGQKPAHLDGLAYCEPGGLVGHIGKRQRIHFGLHLPQTIRFGLLRAVS